MASHGPSLHVFVPGRVCLFGVTAATSSLRCCLSLRSFLASFHGLMWLCASRVHSASTAEFHVLLESLERTQTNPAWEIMASHAQPLQPWPATNSNVIVCCPIPYGSEARAASLDAPCRWKAVWFARFCAVPFEPLRKSPNRHSGDMCITSCTPPRCVFSRWMHSSHAPNAFGCCREFRLVHCGNDHMCDEGWQNCCLHCNRGWCCCFNLRSCAVWLGEIL